jgi:hypothetical protein
MLSASAAVAPLRPVLGVSLDCEPDRGMFKRERFWFESPSAVAVDGPCDEDWPGAKELVAMAL